MDKAPEADPSEFDFLDSYPLLKYLFRETERLATPSPMAAIAMSRAFLDELLKEIARRTGQPPRHQLEDLEKFIWRLRDNLERVSAQIHLINRTRRIGNSAAHADRIFSDAEGQAAFQRVIALARWFEPELREKGKSTRPVEPSSIGPGVASVQALPTYHLQLEERVRRSGSWIMIVYASMVITFGLYVWHVLAIQTLQSVSTADAPPKSLDDFCSEPGLYGSHCFPETQTPAHEYLILFDSDPAYAGPATSYAVTGRFASGTRVEGVATAIDETGDVWIRLRSKGWVRAYTLIEAKN